MKQNLINIFIGILALVFGLKLYNSNKGADSQDKNIVAYDNFCQNGAVLSAKIDSFKQQQTSFVHKISYTYNHKNYQQSITSNKKFEGQTVEISILKNNPNDFVVGNACKNLTNEIKNNKSVFWEYLGILLIVYGAFVIFIKSLKIIFSIKDKYKDLAVFERKTKREIPGFIRKIFEHQIRNAKNIEFEIPHYGAFQIINYTISQGDNFDNPYHILKEIEEYIERYMFPVLNYSKIIPFAVNQRYSVLFVEEGKEDIILVDLDSENKPLVLQNKIDYYIDVNKLEFINNKYYFNGLKKIQDILNENEYFFDIPDCISEGKDYYEILDKSFSLLEKKPDFSILNIEETQDSYILNLKIEDQSKKIKLQRYSDYVDGEKLIKNLNEILSLLNYDKKKYYLLSNNICDFGIALAAEITYQTLLSNGCIDLNEDELKLNSDEVTEIRKYSDLITQIENIEFHLSIVKKNNEIKKGLIYNFLYETKYEFDNNGIIELKKKLKVNLKKTDSGYEIYFEK
ncbi:hypothetical protein [Flavobacterium notoginsengisoli]|uniref:hypothetical protein n=1 Tax=Flavobacterium notoginsengisoli TaxID=1478199 RepID=UPI00363574B6